MNKRTKNTSVKHIKCEFCEYYNKQTDFCKEKEIENVSKQVNTNFSQCDDYLVNSKLVMF